MELKRKFYYEMLEWKKTNGETAMMIDGARRVGKSFIAEEFAKNEYKSYLLVDFAHVSKEVISIFENESYDLDIFYNKLSAFYKVRLYSRNSAILFDEVQLYPPARQLVKYLVADGRYDIIETGSLFTLRTKTEGIMIPSEEEHFELFPMDFEEFLWAMGDETTIPFLKTCFENHTPLGQALHRRVMNDFRQYILVGGMPQAVKKYAETKDFAATDKVKRQIITLYRNDAGKYAGTNATKVNQILDEIPGQLSKKEKKYKLSSISKNARSRDYEDSFMWLTDAMIVNPCYNSTDPNVGLELNKESTTQKIYMGDTGLLVTHAFMDKKFMDNEIYRAVLLDKLNINEGMIMENIVSQMLRRNGHKLFFYSRSDTNNRKHNIEIDFLIASGKKIRPIEVKSAEYKAHSSIDKFRAKFKRRLDQPIVLYPKDVMEKDGVLHLPLYMAFFL